HLSGHWYLFDGVTGARKTGFQYIGNQRKTVYYNGNGQMQYGQQHLSGHWYLFDGVTGARKTGFQYIGNQRKTVYYNGSGQMQYGQQHLSGHWYLFDGVTGARKTGFQYISNQHKIVYYANNGQMQYGTHLISGKNYYFNYTTGALQLSQNIASFLNSIADAARQVAKRYNLYPSLMVAQAALESAWGDSTLARNAHNLFGVKYNGQGSYVTMPTVEYYNNSYHTVSAKFQSYQNYYASLERYAQLISTNFYNSTRSRAANVTIAAQNLYRGKYGSYATDPSYAAKLISIINSNGLTSYDN
ncbi:MAG: glucosaminidase domain-containing protein, partial [Liquorilactobacillus ghanensis]|uniref:glucosaminidase domain-containing protein n=1 Tax=Liquorilactobacillus ghanensis TaxID=399370 RepID=UPI0039E89304